ncbi:MAG: RsbRD N-terminal domain-containing protein [Acidobacteria bacterium]|nr:RsbRD N-terminal domain-containing protein [Acidobacteriota bacterium]
MVSAKLVHQIEDHWEAISGRFLRLLRASHGLPHLSHIPESETTDACRKLLHNLGHWLVSSSEEEVARLYEKVGRDRYNQGMPISESIRAIQLMKDATLDFIRDEAEVRTGFDFAAEEELEFRLGRFFDLLTYHSARGYEQACGVKSH